MKDRHLFEISSPVSARQPKTDRLILPSLLKNAVTDQALDKASIELAHGILLKWVELDSSNRLASLNETQMQGDFLAEVFGQALGYSGPLENQEIWHREQHVSIAGQMPDAILGVFSQEKKPHQPLVVVELKGPNVHLDRDRSNNRTAIDQCWDYLVNAPPTCRWGIVSNFVSFRLYERDSTKRVYEHFTLQSLRDVSVFKQFYYLFHRQGLVEKAKFYDGPRAPALLKQTIERQRQVGDKLYEDYSSNRAKLISQLHFKLKHSLNDSIEMAQRLFDRIMFIAFCEDRRLLPEKTIPKAYTVAGFYAVTNPRWQSFKNLFRFIDEGNETEQIPRYNGGLFAKHAVDDLELPDTPWANFFHSISTYDFADEVNLDVLGHLFERSITELEKLKESGLFGGDAEKTSQFATMPQSAKRKQLGIYYTPAELTSRIVRYTVEELIAQRFAAAATEFGIPKSEAERGVTPENLEFWRRCLEILRSLKVVDPACGSGAFLFQAYNALEQRYFEVLRQLERTEAPEASTLGEQIPRFILQENLYGVDLSPEAVEITQLALWIRSAAPGHTLATLSANIVHGNSLVHDPAIHPAGFDWRERFPSVFDREESGFDCVIGNPPWERIKLQNREFFSLSAPELLTITNASKQRQAIADLEIKNPVLFNQYKTAYEASHKLLDYCRESERYPLTGRGDTNLFAVFTELANSLVAPHGRVGLLVPSGIAFDHTTRAFFAEIAESSRLFRLYDFENKKIYFPEVHASFKYCILNFGGKEVTSPTADFAFFLHRVEELEDTNRHVPLSGADIRLLNPNSRTCPIFRWRRDAEVTKRIYRRVPVLIDQNRKGETGNPWRIAFKTMFHQSSNAELFKDRDWLEAEGFVAEGSSFVKDPRRYVPLYEAKMFRSYDHRYASAYDETSNWTNQGQTVETTLVQHANPEYAVSPRWWVDQEAVTASLSPASPTALLAFRDVTRSTDVRTFIASMIPCYGAVHTAPIILLRHHEPKLTLCLLACMNSMPYDYIAKQKTGQIHMSYFIIEQIPTLPPDTYSKPCPWDRNTSLEAWISERVLKLTCTAEDMLPLAEACNFTSGSFQSEYGGRLNKWDEAERAELMADLDAAFFLLYGINRDDMEYILTTFKGIDAPCPHFPGYVSMATRIIQRYTELSFAG